MISTAVKLLSVILLNLHHFLHLLLEQPNNLSWQVIKRATAKQPTQSILLQAADVYFLIVLKLFLYF